MMIELEKETGLALGSAEAAVRSCVSLMAAVMGQREELLAYWLDLYYQVRLAYERENAAEPDPTVLRRGDLYPVLRELMQDALKSAVRGEAKDRMERKKAAANCPSQSAAPQASSECRTLPARQDALPEGASQENKTVAEIMGPQIGIRGPVEGDAPGKLKGWAKKKHDIRERLLHARDQGVTAAQIRTASDDALTEKEIYGVINAEKTNIEIYRLIEAALDALGK